MLVATTKKYEKEQACQQPTDQRFPLLAGWEAYETTYMQHVIFIAKAPLENWTYKVSNYSINND